MEHSVLRLNILHHHSVSALFALQTPIKLTQYFWLLAVVFILLVTVVFFIIFEKRRMKVEKMVMIAILSAISAVGRGLFAAIPSVQPSSFIIIMTGLTLGAEAGFMTGALTALLSGLWMGLGPWTPWQMFAWGLMGCIAGMLRKPLARHKSLRIAYGAVGGLVFGWIMNIWMLMSVDSVETGLAYMISLFMASFVFDSLHAAANALLIAFGGDALLKVLSRMAVKYGLTAPE